MKPKPLALALLALLALNSACTNKEARVPTNADREQSAEVTAPTQADAAPELKPDPLVDGPFLIQIQEAFPNQIFGSAATNKYLALAGQSDTRQIELCPKHELQVCFRGLAYLTERSNPNQPKTLLLYEADTQSGTRVDDLVAAGERFVFAINDGRYVGDQREAQLVLVHPESNIEERLKLNADKQNIEETALAHTEGNEVLLCHRLGQKRDDALLPTQEILCESLDVSAKPLLRHHFAHLRFSTAVHKIALAANDKQAVLAWISGGRAYLAFLKAPRRLIELGAATTQELQIVEGHGGFIVAWQDNEGLTRLTRVEQNSTTVKSIKLNGLQLRSLSGLASIREGFLTAFRFDKTQQLALVAPDLSSWELVEDSKVWRMFSNQASLILQDAAHGKFLWQSAYFLLQQR